MKDGTIIGDEASLIGGSVAHSSPSVVDLIDIAASMRPGKAAIVDDGGAGAVSFEELVETSHRLAAYLLHHGVEPGDRVAMMMRNSAEFLISYVAILRCGGVAVPLNIRHNSEELGQVLADCSPRALIAAEEYAEGLAPIADEAGMEVRIVAGSAPGYVSFKHCVGVTAERVKVCVDETSPCTILYTAGSTGRPKGVVRSRRAIALSVLYSRELIGMDRDEVYLATPPMFHIAGLETAALPMLAAGATIVTTSAFEPSRFLAAIQRHEVTHVFAVPAMCIAILKLCNVADYSLDSVRVWFSASALLPEAVRDGIRKLVPGAQVRIGYGATEIGPVTKPAPMAYPTNCVGSPFVGVLIKIVDGNDRELGRGEIGEIVFRCPTMFSYYWNDELATRQATRTGWYHTGDVGYLDTDGYLFLVDRKKDIIITGGENVSAIEVENILFEFGGIREGAVIGVPDDRWGEAVTAVVVASEGAYWEDGEVIEFCRGRLAHYKAPRKVVRVGSLPRNAFGKVDKVALRRRFAGGDSR